ncbi:MAG: hypothetical protein AB4057_19755 [Crocosphaera sp.]
MKSENIAEIVLKSVKEEDLTHWLKQFLLNRETPPPNVYQFIPRDFPDSLDYFIVCLPYLEKYQIIKLGNKSLELLIQIEFNHILSDNSLRSEEERSLLKQLLLLLEVLPTSNPDTVISNLEKLRSNRQIVSFPALHRRVLLTLANQFLNINSNTQERKDWAKKLIEEMLTYPRVTMAAFAALSRISIDVAIYYFPLALKQLNEINLPIPNICFDLTSQIGENPKKWEQLATRLEYHNLQFSINQSDKYIYDKAKNYISRALNILDFQESLKTFEETLSNIQESRFRLDELASKLQNTSALDKTKLLTLNQPLLKEFSQSYFSPIKDLLIDEENQKDNFQEEVNENINKKLTITMWNEIDKFDPNMSSFSNCILSLLPQEYNNNNQNLLDFKYV